MSNSTGSSEFPSPGSPAEDGVELHGPVGFPAHLTPMPVGMILFPRRMLYVEAVLYLLVAAASFGVGYLIARNGPSKAASKDGGSAAAEGRLPLEGTVMLDKSGKKQPDVGAVVIALPADRSLKALPAARFRPGDAPPTGSDDPAMNELRAFGGAMAQIGVGGHFQLLVPRPGPYHVFVISPHGARDTFNPYEKSDLKDFGNYFDDPTELLHASPTVVMKER